MTALNFRTKDLNESKHVTHDYGGAKSMCRSAQKGVYLKELIAEVRAARAKRKVGRTPAPAKPAALANWAFAIFRKA